MISLRPIVGDIVDYHDRDESIRCAVVRDHSSALMRVNYDGSRASLTLVTESGVEGRALWVSNDETVVTIVRTDWSQRLLFLLLVIAHAARIERQRRFAKTDTTLALLRSAGLL